MYRRILMPTDGSECSDLAIRQGLELAKALGSGVTLLHTLEDPTAMLYGAGRFGNFYHQPELYEDFKKAATEILARAKSVADSVGVAATTVLVEREDPVEAILEAEKTHDLVVMGTHGRRGFNRWMFGSVAEGVSRRSTKPVLTIRGGRALREAEG